MKTVLSVAVAVVMPFGFFILAGVIVGRMVAKYRQNQSRSRRTFPCGTSPGARIPSHVEISPSRGSAMSMSARHARLLRIAATR